MKAKGRDTERERERERENEKERENLIDDIFRPPARAADEANTVKPSQVEVRLSCGAGNSLGKV